ncbi:MAG TPA: hypothetical protein PK786_10120 [Treponemataceae bacterium]|nr:hypothetical protein [Treponemataceae bacterium]HQF74234.1 hypothetical protein [Treponemataceae bacterium]HRR03391.1 hypothetical protein [Treponemataceae bacterium]
MSDFFIGELLVLLLLVPVLLRPFVRSLQSIRGIVFLPPVALIFCILIIAGSGFPVSFFPVFFVVTLTFFGGLARMSRALRGLATDWYSLSSRIYYLVLLPVFLCSVAAAFYSAPENSYLGSVSVEKSVVREKAAAGVLAFRHEWSPSAETARTATVVFFGDVSGGAVSRSTLAAVLSEQGYGFQSDDYRSFYAWDRPAMAWPAVRFLAVRLGEIVSGRALATDDEELYRLTRLAVARTMSAVRTEVRDAPLFIVAEGNACVPVAEYLHATGFGVQGFVCLVQPEAVAPLSRALDGSGFEGQYTVVASETSMIPRFSAHLPVLVLSGEPGTMIGRGELDADDVLAALLLGGTRDTGRKRAERLARRIGGWFSWKIQEEEAQP